MLDHHTVANAAINTVFAGNRIVKSTKKEVEAVIGNIGHHHVANQVWIVGRYYKNGDPKMWDIRPSDDIYTGEDSKTIIAIVRHVGAGLTDYLIAKKAH